MASEAQKLIGISLTKIAQSRSHRGGVSLHKNLLVATVLQKARYIFMEEAYNMVHFQPPAPVQVRPVPEEELVGLTAEEGGQEDLGEAASQCSRCVEQRQNKENCPPRHKSELTYLDLDSKGSSGPLRERSNSACLKRRRAVAEWETEEAVQSILPKRTRVDDDAADDSVFLDEAQNLSESVAKELRDEQEEDSDPSSSPAMEIDRITSLVSIFSFSMGDPKLTRSVSTPDLCSAQAKDPGDTLQQRPFLAMTV